MQTIATLAELDEKIEACNRAEAVSDDAMRAVFGTFRMAPPADLPADPFAPEYRERQMRLYEDIAGRGYSTANEATPFDVEAAARRPFPYYTGSGATAGEHFMAIGFLLRAMALPPGSRVLEFGPGWGNSTLMLARLGHRVTAVDIEPRFCELIQRRAAQEQVEIRTVAADFLWAETCEEQFDAIVFFECFHHCADHLRLLRALRRIVAPEGRLFFGAEPIGPDCEMPWGLRLDGNSLWAIRKNGWLELGFRDDYFQEALRRTGWEGRRIACADPAWLTVWEATRNDRPLRFPATDGRLATQTGSREDGAILFAASPAGTALQGPYVTLAAGRYRARLRFAADRPLEGRAHLDVASHVGERILALRELDLASLRATGGIAEIEFDGAAEMPKLEVRLFGISELTARFEGLEILPLD